MEIQEAADAAGAEEPMDVDNDEVEEMEVDIEQVTEEKECFVKSGKTRNHDNGRFSFTSESINILRMSVTM